MPVYNSQHRLYTMYPTRENYLEYLLNQRLPNPQFNSALSAYLRGQLSPRGARLYNNRTQRRIQDMRYRGHNLQNYIPPTNNYYNTLAGGPLNLNQFDFTNKKSILNLVKSRAVTNDDAIRMLNKLSPRTTKSKLKKYRNEIMKNNIQSAIMGNNCTPNTKPVVLATDKNDIPRYWVTQNELIQWITSFRNKTTKPSKIYTQNKLNINDVLDIFQNRSISQSVKKTMLDILRR